MVSASANDTMKLPGQYTFALFCCWFLCALAARGQSVEAVVVEVEGTVEVSRAGGIWDRAYATQTLFAGDRLRTMERSRATVRVGDLSPIRVNELSLLEMPAKSRFSLLRGVIYFFHRDKPESWNIQTPTVATLIRGTEFNLAVATNGTPTLTLVDGEVEMSNEHGRVTLRSGEEGTAKPGEAPQKTVVIDAMKVVQWALYYPGVLTPDELGFTEEEKSALSKSLSAYRAGDIRGALEAYPKSRQAGSDRERIYRAALVLSVGQVSEAEGLLKGVADESAGAAAHSKTLARLANALQKVIGVVTGQESSSSNAALTLSTEWLAESYQQQEQVNLEGALRAAEAAAAVAPQFGFAWARVAELQFSFGRVPQARAALEKALALSPRNAQALALQGFLYAADNQVSTAIDSFDRAIAADGALGNAWLGRGLCRIRKGDSMGGLQDLEVAATLEPNRAILRSYLGKAFSHKGDEARATEELGLARKLDPNDPTAWLYSALLNQQRNRINEAIRDLEESRARNDNRAVYRSRLLLDQDRGVQRANLANMYRDAGLVDVSLWEAAKAVSDDYANASAHYFLANSYNALRDPGQVNLRYETPWLSEYLVANLLAPANAGTLSPIVSQQEYSRLFEGDRFGVANVSEYYSRGDWLQAAAQHGVFGDTAYAVEGLYRFENGEWPNTQLEQLSLSLRLKHELTPRDGVYAQAIYYDAQGGDLARHFSREDVNTSLRVEERQEPILIGGYHHQWAPGSDTLLLAGRLHDKVAVDNGDQEIPLFDRTLGSLSDVHSAFLEQEYESELEIYMAEAQHIWQQGRHTIIAGGRVQAGEFDTSNSQDDLRSAFPFLAFSGEQDVTPGFERYSGYGYYYLRVASPLVLQAGLSYDWLSYPVNHRFGPVVEDETEKDQFSPKAGFIWTPLTNTTVRAAYSRSLGGVSFDQSFQLEPSQVAGFNQAWRSIIPESAAGPATAPEFDTYGVSFEQKFGRATYVGLAGEWLESDVRREVGVLEVEPSLATLPSATKEDLDYRERSILASLYQLVGDEWSLGVRYRLSQAELTREFVHIPAAVNFHDGLQRRDDLESTLHQANPFIIFNHPSGFFANVDGLWTHQDNKGQGVGDENFWQFNAFVGYRFLQRRLEVRVGVVNVTDQDYELSPLNLTAYLPRGRAFTARVAFNF